MDIHQLQYFIGVVKHGNITKAAAELYVSQPTISVAIRRLETELGFPLFIRNKNKLILTGAGKVYYDEILPAIEIIAEAQKKADKEYQKSKSLLKIAVPHPFGGDSSSLTMELAKLDIEFKFYASSNYTSDTLKRMLMDGTLDLCIHSPALHGNNLTTEVLSRRRMFAFVSNKHRLADRKSIKLSELSGEVFSSLPKGFGSRELLEDYCRQAGFAPKVEYEYSVAAEGMTAAASNLCITVGTLTRYKPLIDSGEVIPLSITQPECFTNIAMTWKTGKETDPYFQKVLEVVRKRKRPDYGDQFRGRK